MSWIGFGASLPYATLALSTQKGPSFGGTKPAVSTSVTGRSQACEALVVAAGGGGAPRRSATGVGPAWSPQPENEVAANRMGSRRRIFRFYKRSPAAPYTVDLIAYPATFRPDVMRRLPTSTPGANVSQ